MDEVSPLITTVIPTYRRPEFLRRAVESVRSQTFPHWRLLVLDNASGDATEAAMTELTAQDRRIEYIRHPANIGMMPNFQAGYDRVATPFFSFLSDDDMLLPHFYATALQALRQEPDARLFCSQAVVFNPERRIHRIAPGWGWAERRYDTGEAALPMTQSHCLWGACLFSSELRPLVGPLAKTDFADLAFLIKATCVAPVVYRPIPCILYTDWPNSATVTSPVSRYMDGFRQIAADVAHYGRLAPEVLAAIHSLLDQELATVVFHRLRAGFLKGDWDQVVAAGEFLGRRNGLKRGTRLRTWLAQPGRRNGLLTTLIHRWIAGRHAARRKRGDKKAASEGVTAEALVQRYTLAAAPAGPDATA
ncbi:MAG: glycosyltransferase family 2 protein [Planctomycetota bacterium]